MKSLNDPSSPLYGLYFAPDGTRRSKAEREAILRDMHAQHKPQAALEVIPLPRDVRHKAAELKQEQLERARQLQQDAKPKDNNPYRAILAQLRDQLSTAYLPHEKSRIKHRIQLYESQANKHDAEQEAAAKKANYLAHGAVMNALAHNQAMRSTPPCAEELAAIVAAGEVLKESFDLDPVQAAGAYFHEVEKIEARALMHVDAKLEELKAKSQPVVDEILALEAQKSLLDPSQETTE